MAMQSYISVSDELLSDVKLKAAADGKSVEDVAQDALRQYLDKDAWQRLIASKRAAARDRGLTEVDVPRLVEEARQERRNS